MIAPAVSGYHHAWRPRAPQGLDLPRAVMPPVPSLQESVTAWGRGVIPIPRAGGSDISEPSAQGEQPPV